MSEMAGWALYLVLVATNIAIYLAIDMGFETNFWREDEE
tara:strand:+ start:240 stop:356 length:117 start_codon:yes stop_codon:yes gene_type:complete